MKKKIHPSLLGQEMSRRQFQQTYFLKYGLTGIWKEVVCQCEMTDFGTAILDGIRLDFTGVSSDRVSLYSPTSLKRIINKCITSNNLYSYIVF